MTRPLLFLLTGSLMLNALAAWLLADRTLAKREAQHKMRAAANIYARAEAALTSAALDVQACERRINQVVAGRVLRCAGLSDGTREWARGVRRGG
jgi:hypothetical protein